MSLQELSTAYAEARGLNGRSFTVPTGKKLSEETTELVIALAKGDRMNTLEEIADVAISLAVIAESIGASVEACIEAKTIKDTGRGFSNGVI